MESHPTISLRASQQLVLSLAMRQSLHILELPIVELGLWLKQQIEMNPTLEVEDSKEVFTDDCPDVAALPTLFEHLMKQAINYFTTSVDLETAQLIIGNLDHRGFFIPQTPLSHSVKSILKLIQTFDPPGIAAGSLQECLLFQVEKNTLAHQIVKDFFEDLLAGRLSFIEQSLKCNRERLRKEIRERISPLSFNPAAPFEKHEARIITPDLYILQSGKGFSVSINRDEIPDFSLSPLCENLLEDAELPSKDRLFIRRHLASAKWLLRSLERRESTLKKMGHYLARYQRSFLEGGNLYPLTIKQVAQELGVHESTIARAVQDKYCFTDRGMIPLKHFFPKKLKADTSSAAAKELLLKLVETESKKKPYSDEALAAEIGCSRRTVTKYRQTLAIPPARLRKR